MRTKRPARAVSDFRYSPLAAAISLAFGALDASAGNTFQVTVQGDRPIASPTTPNTLRDAIEFFNINNTDHCTNSGDKITFFANGPFIVGVSDALPIIACSGLTIEGQYLSNPADPTSIQNAVVDGGRLVTSTGLYAATAAPVNVQDLHVQNFAYGTALLGNINSGNNVLRLNNVGYDPSNYTGLTVADSLIQSNTVGIRVTRNATGTTVRGNSVNTNQTGIFVSYGGSTVLIEGNTITGNTNGTLVNAKGIYMEGSSAVINNNVISGNDFPIYFDSDRGSAITNNRIGTTGDGLSPFSNNFGITITKHFPSATPTRDTQISNNVISGNRGHAIDISEFSNVSIAANKIGIKGDGTLPPMGNGGGIIAYCGTGLQVTDNVISGNNGSGIEIGAVQGGGLLNISGNKIGVSGDGVTALGNNAYGVALRFGSCGRFTTGGTNNLQITGNIIANNTSDGVLVSNGVGNLIVQNSIYANGEKNINLGSPGLLPRPNDALDADIGPNNGQNYPDNVTAVRNWPGGYTMVGFTLDGPVGTYRIDIYSNGTSGSPGGKIYHGNTFLPISTPGPTSGSFAVAPLDVFNRPNNFSLTATAVATNDTSEFSLTAFITPSPAVTVTPNPPNLDFGQVSVNSIGPPQSITLRSSGNEPYNMNKMRIGNCFGPAIYGGPFMISSTCVTNANYAPGQICQITGQFAPIVLGLQTTTIAICDNSKIDGTRFFNLSGTSVVPPPITIAPSAFDFGSVLAGSKSPPQQFVITNPSPGLVSIGPVQVSSGDFVIDSSTCGTSLPSAGLCTALVRFAPSQPVRSNATLFIAAAGAIPSSAPADKALKFTLPSPATSALTGLGIQVADIRLPASIDFGDYTVGTPPIRQTVDIVNIGNAVVSFTNISVTGPFVMNNRCPLNIGPGEQCQITLDFSSTTLGNFSGALAVVSNAVGGTRNIPLTAHTVAVAAPRLSLSPLTVSFGDRLLGTTSATQRITIRNIGNAPALIGSVTASPDFVVLGNTCSLPLAPTSTCFADVALQPVGFGPRAGSLFVNSNAPDSPNVVSLHGTGCRPFSGSSSRFGVGSGFNCAP